MSNRSFVIRKGRITPAQERALEEHWQSFGLDCKQGEILNLEKIFLGYKNFVVEIGFGNGESLLEMAGAFPETAFIGIEVYPSGVGRILAGIVERQIKNLRIIRADAAQVMSSFVAESLDRVQIYFPDPWQKLRHHKRRLVQKEFCDLVWKKLKIAGHLHLATDWENYAEWMRDILLPDAKWQNLGEATGFIPKPAYRPLTKFEQRAIAQNHGIWDLLYAKIEQ